MSKNEEPLRLDLEQYTQGLLVWVSNKLSASASALYRRLFDLGVTDWRVLAYIEIYPWSTGAQVCELIGLDKAAVSRSFGMLAERGLLHSRPNGLRKVEYATTADGQRVYQQVLRVALERFSLASHSGSHPNVGVIDVVPIVFLDDFRRAIAMAEALATAERLSSELELPVFLYGELAGGRTRAELRRGGSAGT